MIFTPIIRKQKIEYETNKFYLRKKVYLRFILEPREICKLPLSKGLCRALIPRWWYDAGSGKCIPFNFGGCDGNENNFPSEKACLSTCSSEFFSVVFHDMNCKNGRFEKSTVY